MVALVITRWSVPPVVPLEHRTHAPLGVDASAQHPLGPGYPGRAPAPRTEPWPSSTRRSTLHFAACAPVPVDGRVHTLSGTHPRRRGPSCSRLSRLDGPSAGAGPADGGDPRVENAGNVIERYGCCPGRRIRKPRGLVRIGGGQLDNPRNPRRRAPFDAPPGAGRPSPARYR